MSLTINTFHRQIYIAHITAHVKKKKIRIRGHYDATYNSNENRHDYASRELLN